MLQLNRGKFKMFSDKTAKFLLLAALVICVGGAFAPNWIVNQFMFGFSRALAILGLMVLWRTGLVSFGHAFYFGLGAYAVAILDSKLGVSDVFLRLMAGAVVAGVAGFLIGRLKNQQRPQQQHLPLGEETRQKRPICCRGSQQHTLPTQNRKHGRRRPILCATTP